MNRRGLLNTSLYIAPALAMTACAAQLQQVGNAIGSGAVAKIVSYVQGALSGLSVLAATFLPTSTSVSDSLKALQNFAASIGSSISTNASWLTGSTATQVGNLISAVVKAIQLGLSVLPGGATLTLAMTVVGGIEAAIPTLVGFIDSLVSPSTPAVGAPAPAVSSMLRLMVP